MIKSTNAGTNGATGKTETEMKEIKAIQKFVDLMNEYVKENTGLKTWKVVNGTPVFDE